MRSLTRYMISSSSRRSPAAACCFAMCFKSAELAFRICGPFSPSSPNGSFMTWFCRDRLQGSSTVEGGLVITSAGGSHFLRRYVAACCFAEPKLREESCVTTKICSQPPNLSRRHYSMRFAMSLWRTRSLPLRGRVP